MEPRKCPHCRTQYLYMTSATWGDDGNSEVVWGCPNLNCRYKETIYYDKNSSDGREKLQQPFISG